jgi:hypothetical protein
VISVPVISVPGEPTNDPSGSTDGPDAAADGSASLLPQESDDDVDGEGGLGAGADFLLPGSDNTDGEDSTFLLEPSQFAEFSNTETIVACP